MDAVMMMLRTNHDNPLKLIRLDETILIIVQICERLPKTLALETLHELCELIVCRVETRQQQKRTIRVRNSHPRTCAPFFFPRYSLTQSLWGYIRQC